MRLTEITYGSALPVDGYGPGFFRVGGALYDGAILILPGGVSGWGGYEDTAPILAAARSLDLLLVGTGAGWAPLPAAFRALLEDAGLGVEVMASPPACRSYNMLLAEGRRVALALLPV